MAEHRRYRHLRALIEDALAASDSSVRAAPAAPSPAAAGPPALEELIGYLAMHCSECGLLLERPAESSGSDQAGSGGLAGLCADCASAQAPRADRSNPAAIVQALTRHGADPAEAARLAAFVARAPERELYRATPLLIAERLQMPVRPTLSLLAAAMIAGIFTLNWELYCLACLHQEEAFDSLSEATSRQTCKNCHATFDAPLDEEIMVTFTVTPGVRALEFFQAAPLNADLGWWYHFQEAYGRVSGRDLLTVQAFHDFFVNEPLPSHESFGVTRLAFVFTDLSGSTALYARQGDPRAYSVVQKHFVMLTGLVGQAGGALVKTIGDAIMAVFPTSDLALRAALAAQAAIRAFNLEHHLHDGEALQLKVGLHSGPCLAVTLNQRLDYFGTTVNAAARIQKLAGPGEVVLSAAIREDLADAAPLAGFALRPEQHTFRGLDDRPFTVYTVQP